MDADDQLSESADVDDGQASEFMDVDDVQLSEFNFVTDADNPQRYLLYEIVVENFRGVNLGTNALRLHPRILIRVTKEEGKCIFRAMLFAAGASPSKMNVSGLRDFIREGCDEAFVRFIFHADNNLMFAFTRTVCASNQEKYDINDKVVPVNIYRERLQMCGVAFHNFLDQEVVYHVRFRDWAFFINSTNVLLPFSRNFLHLTEQLFFRRIEWESLKSQRIKLELRLHHLRNVEKDPTVLYNKGNWEKYKVMLYLVRLHRNEFFNRVKFQQKNKFEFFISQYHTLKTAAQWKITKQTEELEELKKSDAYQSAEQLHLCMTHEKRLKLEELLKLRKTRWLHYNKVLQDLNAKRGAALENAYSGIYDKWIPEFKEARKKDFEEMESVGYELKRVWDVSVDDRKESELDHLRTLIDFWITMCDMDGVNGVLCDLYSLKNDTYAGVMKLIAGKYDQYVVVDGISTLRACEKYLMHHRPQFVQSVKFLVRKVVNEEEIEENATLRKCIEGQTGVEMLMDQLEFYREEYKILMMRATGNALLYENWDRLMENTVLEPHNAVVADASYFRSSYGISIFQTNFEESTDVLKSWNERILDRKINMLEKILEVIQDAPENLKEEMEIKEVAINAVFDELMEKSSASLELDETEERIAECQREILDMKRRIPVHFEINYAVINLEGRILLDTMKRMEYLKLKMDTEMQLSEIACSLTLAKLARLRILSQCVLGNIKLPLETGSEEFSALKRYFPLTLQLNEETRDIIVNMLEDGQIPYSQLDDVTLENARTIVDAIKFMEDGIKIDYSLIADTVQNINEDEELNELEEAFLNNIKNEEKNFHGYQAEEHVKFLEDKLQTIARITDPRIPILSKLKANKREWRTKFKAMMNAIEEEATAIYRLLHNDDRSFQVHLELISSNNSLFTGKIRVYIAANGSTHPLPILELSEQILASFALSLAGVIVNSPAFACFDHVVAKEMMSEEYAEKISNYLKERHEDLRLMLLIDAPVPDTLRNCGFFILDRESSSVVREEGSEVWESVRVEDSEVGGHTREEDSEVREHVSEESLTAKEYGGARYTEDSIVQPRQEEPSSVIVQEERRYDEDSDSEMSGIQTF